MEELHSEPSVIVNLSALEMRAAAAPKMTNKAIEGMGIDALQSAAPSLNETTEMGSGTNVSNGAGWSVSVALEAICEYVDVRSADSTPQAPQSLGRGEIRL